MKYDRPRLLHAAMGVLEQEVTMDPAAMMVMASKVVDEVIAALGLDKQTVGGIHQRLAKAMGNPDRVYCRTCGNSAPVNAAECFANGWPECCGATMTVDKPEGVTP